MTGERALEIVNQLVNLAHQYRHDDGEWMSEGFIFATEVADELGRPIPED